VIVLDTGADADTVKTDFPPLRMLVGAAESVTAGCEAGGAVGVGVGVGVGDPEELKA